METWLILGAGSAIARAFARQVAAKGAAVVLAGRDVEDLAANAADLTVRFGIQARALPFDAAATDTHAAFVAGLGVEGRLNVFLAFGTMVPQAEAEADPARAIAMANTNLVGAMSVLLYLASELEQRGSGRVVVLGSVAGDRGRGSNYAYGATKAGLHAFVEGLTARLWRAGISVTLIKPGFVDTAMTWGLPGLFLVASPEAAASACLTHAEAGRETAYVPAFWWGIMSIIRAIPNRVFKRLKL